MIKIAYEYAYHQYDEHLNIITDWDAEGNEWIVRPEYADEEIDWNGFSQIYF